MHHYSSQRFFANAAFADARMAIFMGTAFVEGIVNVQGTQPIQPDHAVEFLEHAIQIIRNVISRIPYMAGIEANTQMAIKLNAVDDGRQFFEGTAYLASLSCHGFQQKRGGLLGCQHGIQDLGNKLDTRIRTLPPRVNQGEC